MNRPGSVALIGAGPGSADLLTVRAVRLLACADWVVHDALIEPDVLALAPRATLIAAGKRAGRVSTRQADINRTLVDCARRGGLVVRLKGGDPLIFGRAREELDALRAAGIAVEVVPGISTAQAAHAALLAPMTERGHRRSLVYATPAEAAAETADDAPASSAASSAAASPDSSPDWAAAIAVAGGGALYMAGARADAVRRRLLDCGLPPGLPATWVVDVARAGQTIVATSLGALGPLPPGLAGRPAILLVGTTTPAPPFQGPDHEPAAAPIPA